MDGWMWSKERMDDREKKKGGEDWRTGLLYWFFNHLTLGYNVCLPRWTPDHLATFLYGPLLTSTPLCLHQIDRSLPISPFNHRTLRQPSLQPPKVVAHPFQGEVGGKGVHNGSIESAPLRTLHILHIPPHSTPHSLWFKVSHLMYLSFPFPPPGLWTTPDHVVIITAQARAVAPFFFSLNSPSQRISLVKQPYKRQSCRPCAAVPCVLKREKSQVNNIQWMTETMQRNIAAPVYGGAHLSSGPCNRHLSAFVAVGTMG